MSRLLILTLIASCCIQSIRFSESSVRGLLIAAPQPESIPRFVTFIEDVLAPRGINTLCLRVDYRYQFESHPELVDEGALSASDVKKLVKACREHEIELIPQINLLGHQSWHSNLGKLLEVYPELDETPDIELPEKYQWPNDDGLYCKSYCPLHPDVHDIVFALVDEIMDAFQASAFHAGMDEVFYIAHPDCPRCAGRDPARLFADEVETIRVHLARENRTLWIWGDRLLDGESTGLGEWEASINDTHPAIDMISKEVVVCDWHYERAEPTPAYFAMKGFPVISCPWNKADVAADHREAFQAFRKTSNPTLANRHLGLMQTVWSGADAFMDEYDRRSTIDPSQKSPVASFLALFPTSPSQ